MEHRFLTTLLFGAIALSAAEKKVQEKDLPPAVQKAVQAIFFCIFDSPKTLESPVTPDRSIVGSQQPVARFAVHDVPNGLNPSGPVRDTYWRARGQSE
jgi:hypothetical protein